MRKTSESPSPEDNEQIQRLWQFKRSEIVLEATKGVIVLIYYFHTFKVLLKSLFGKAACDLAIIKTKQILVSSN